MSAAPGADPLGSDPHGTDPYDTAALRAAVLAAYAASPARLREDANAEEDLARGGYRDRVVVELAQNAADAAVRAGLPGRLLLALDGDVLLAANTGAPLDAAGVAALSTLRASAKRPGATAAATARPTEPPTEAPATATVGRFGVGFAAVRAVSDEIAIGSAPAAVQWSLAATRAALDDLARTAGGDLAAEAARRGDALPVLRLPAPAATPPTVPEGYDTAVRLRLRDRTATHLVGRLLGDVGDALLLALPALREVVVDSDGVRRTLTASTDGAVVVVDEGDRSTRWHRLARTGRLDPALLADRPVEERERPVWDVAVAVATDTAGHLVPLPGTVPRVLHAPTPTDEPLTLPALVVASVPVDPSRRRTAPGPLLDAVLAEVARAYADLVASLPPAPDLLALVPPPLPDGAVDAALGTRVLDTLRRTAWLPPARADEAQQRLRPDAAATVPAARGAHDPAVLAAHVAGLVDPSCWGRPELRRLGVAEVDLTDVLDALAGAPRAPAAWRELYAALDGADPDALATLPVPLVDGRLVRGARGTLTGAGVPPDAAATLGVRLVDPAADHPLLRRLGALDASPAAVLGDPRVAAAVADASEGGRPDPDDLERLAEAVLALLAAGGPGADVLAWLADLPLRDEDGEPAPARELVLPGSPASAVLDAAEVAPVAPDLLERWGADVLARAGVLERLSVVRDADVPLDGSADHDLPDEDAWTAAVRGRLAPTRPGDDLPPVLVELVAVRDLDLVRPDAWPAVLRMLGADPDLRAAVLGPARVLDGRGARREVPTYTAWWVGRFARLGGRRLGDLRLPGADPALTGLYDPLPPELVETRRADTAGDGVSRPVEAPGDVDRPLLEALGVRSTLGRLAGSADGVADLLDRLGDPARQVPAAHLPALLAAVATVDPEQIAPPERVRVPDGDTTRVLAAADALVAGAPYWTQLELPGLLPAVGGPDLAERLADVLDVPLAEEVVEVGPLAGGRPAATPPALAAVLPGAPATYVRHERLEVAGTDVSWWVDDAGTVHAATEDGLARGLAWAAGRWADRLLARQLLRDPAGAALLQAEEAWTTPPQTSAGPDD